MNKSNPSYTWVLQERQARRRMIRRLLYRDKTPVLILLMAALVGTLVGVLFEKAVNGVQARLAALAVLPQHAWLLMPAAFVLSALLAMIGYFLAPLRPGSRRFRHPGNRRHAGRTAAGTLVAGHPGEIYRRHGHAWRRDGFGA